MAAAHHRIYRDAFAEARRIDAFAQRIDQAEELVADHPRIAGERVMAVIDMDVGAADAGEFHLDPHLAGRRLRQRARLQRQAPGLFDHDAAHGVYQFHKVPSSRRATGR